MNHPDTKTVLPEDAAAGADMQRLIDEAMAELTVMQRRALVLFSIEKMPQKDVARMLGCSVEAVKWHVFAARKKMKERLREHL